MVLNRDQLKPQFLLPEKATQRPHRVKRRCVLQQSWQGARGWGCGAGLGVQPPDRPPDSPGPWGTAPACSPLYQRGWLLKSASCQTPWETLINIGDVILFFFSNYKAGSEK